MKKSLLLFLIMAVVASVFADGLVEIKGYGNDDYQVYKEEAAVILEAVENTPIGEFTLNEMKEVALDLSIPFQKMQFVKKSKIASAILPGLGQYMNNDPLAGTLFLISDIAIITGTLIGAYYLLPDELRFDSLDYFRDSRATIKERWENQSSDDLMPTMGVVAAGFVVTGVIRLLSATNAGKLAQKNIAEGKIQFEPKLILPAFDSSGEHGCNRGGFGLGMGMGF
jgi:hypothetical protein